MSVKFIDTTLHNFKEHNSTTFLFEEPKGMNLEKNIHLLNIGIKKLKEENQLPNWFKEKLIESLEATISLLRNIKNQGLRYVVVDIDKPNRMVFFLIQEFFWQPVFIKGY